MRITAKLAYSQLKINRSRTIWTLIAIVLSTALTTAVCSFVASGNAMLVDFLGEDYGLYGKSYIGLLLIPAIIFGLIIIAMSVTVVSNVFRISAQERVTQFGILKCTGATKKQIVDTVMYESILLCVIGIPAGIILGLLLAMGGVGIVNHFLDELNALAHIMIKEIHFSLEFVLSWQAMLVSAVLCFLTVLFSAWLPARKAAKGPAIDCIRGAGDIKISGKQVRTSPLVDRLFGFEGTLAAKNIKRNRRNFRATVILLSVGVTLFIGLGGLSIQANAIMDYIYPNVAHTVIAEYASAYRTDIDEETGRKEKIFLHPIDSETGNRLAEKLEEFEGTDIFGMGADWSTYYTIMPEELISQEMQAAMEKEQENNEFPVEIITLDQEHYEKLCERINIPHGSNILLNHYSYNDFGEEVNLQPFSSDINMIELIKADGSDMEVPIQGILTQEEIPAELLYLNRNPVRLIVPQAQVGSYTWDSTPSDIEGFIDYSNKILGDVFPTKTDSSYMEEGFNTRVYKTNDYAKIMNIAIVLAIVFMYCFVVLLMLIGLTNVISTLSTNVMMRSREFAVLKSVGMTPESLKRMLNFESILCSLKALLYGLPIGIAVTCLINLPIRLMFPIPYRMPWLATCLCVTAVFLITWSTTRYAAHRLEKQNLIETIRAESGK